MSNSTKPAKKTRRPRKRRDSATAALPLEVAAPPVGEQAPEAVAPAVPPPPNVGQILLAVMRQERQAKDAARPAGRTHLYVSEVGTVIGDSACHRRLWLEAHGAEKAALESDTLLQFEFGDAIGWRVANRLAKGDRVEKIELPLSFDGYPLSGRLDVLLRDGWVVEVKTTTLKARNYIPKSDHLAQANLYVHALRQQGYPVHGSVVFYAFRDPAKGQVVSREFAQPYDPTAAQVLLDAFRAAWEVATGPTIPERPSRFSPSAFPCSYCVMDLSCWSRIDPIPTMEEVPSARQE